MNTELLKHAQEEYDNGMYSYLPKPNFRRV